MSDGVFAIVVTLLVLDIHLPDPPRAASEILGELEENLPDFAGWLVSFVVVARLWTVHHHVVSSMTCCRMGTLVRNFAFLGTVSLIPFGASLIGNYGFEEPIALAVFSSIFGLAALALGVVARHAAADPALRNPEGEDLGWYWKHHLVVAPVLCVAAAGLAFLDARIALALFPVEALLVVVATTRARQARSRRSARLAG